MGGAPRADERDRPSPSPGGQRRVAVGNALIAPGVTAREREVLTLVGRGRSNHELADDLGVSPGTARAHVANLLTKLGVRDRVHLVIAAYDAGLVIPG
ncbi:response regulator transcription factor [Streptomyces sp. NBC_00158]|uniref:response regulator transcription factor n=1 Tax=Streptomyces sp. NBC_00158 TaxID=2903627 RepID=UPI003867C432